MQDKQKEKADEKANKEETERKKETKQRLSNDAFLRDFAPRWSDWVKIQPPASKWVIDGWVPHQGITVMSGQEKDAGKSITAFQIAEVVGTGVSTESLVCNTPGDVLYILGEMPHAEVHERVWATTRGQGHRYPSEKVHLNYMQGLKLDKAEDVKRIIRFINLVRPVLVILDTFYYLHDADENKPADLKVVVNSLQYIQSFGPAVLMLAHLNKHKGGDANAPINSQVRGCNALTGVMDYHIALRKYDSKPYDVSPPSVQFGGRSAMKEPGKMIWTFDRRDRLIEVEGERYKENYCHAASFRYVTEEQEAQLLEDETRGFASKLKKGAKYSTEELKLHLGISLDKAKKVRKQLTRLGLAHSTGNRITVKED